MNEQPGHDKANVAKLVAAMALTVLLLSNLAWAIAYSSLSQRVIGVDKSASPSPTPSASVKASVSPSPSATPAQGTIKGNVGYPAGTAPAQAVCAVRVDDASVKVCVDHAAGNVLAYALAVPAGTYYVYASLKAAQGDFTTSYKAYYNKYVTCMAAGNCAMGLHTQYVAVTVAAGGTATGIDPTDWYALGVGQ